MPEPIIDLVALGELASKTAVQHAEHASALEAERAASARLLEVVIATVRPGLKAIAYRPKIATLTRWVDSVSTDTSHELAPWSGVCLDADEPGPGWDHPRANRGEWEGSNLFLRTDGSLVRLDYSGSWSRWQGEADEWKAVVTELSPNEAVKRYGSSSVAEWTARLARRCKAQLEGNQVAQTKASRERTSKLEAIARLA